MAVAVWYLGGFALLSVGALLQIGPFAWAAAWQVRRWGSDNLILSFLPGFAVLAAPVIVLQLLPRRPDWPFLCGAQDALSAQRGTPAKPPPPDQMARLLLRCARVGLALSVIFLIAGVAGYLLIMDIGGRGAGMKLPALTPAETAGEVLPDFARLTGVTAHPEASWVHDYTLRQTWHHDVYTALTGPGWQPGDAVTLLEKESNVVDDSPSPPETARTGPFEGRLERGALPAWMISELRRAGVAVADDPLVLVRRDLDGVVPGADEAGAIVAAAMGTVFALFSLGVSLAWLYKRRKLLRASIH